MSKFNNPTAKPKTVEDASVAEIERIVQGAEAADGRRAVQKTAETEPDEVRFTMTLPGDMADKVDKARKLAGSLTRLSWIRVAIAEKLARDGA